MKRGMKREKGAALLAAMLTVALVATLAAGALWQQWRTTEVEAAERSRLQMHWLLTGALDWARLILREDGRSGGADHLGEPWAVALQESRLSTFLAADQVDPEDIKNVFLSGQIIDLQSRLNVTNLVEGSQISQPALASFKKLFDLLGLPAQELALLAQNLLANSSSASSSNSAEATTSAPTAPLMPQHVEQLTWLGLSPHSLEMLKPHLTILPERTPVNLNTASAQVLYAAIPGMDMASAQRMAAQARLSYFQTLSDANRLLGSGVKPLDTTQHAVSTRFFEVQGRLRVDQLALQNRSVVQRDGLEVKTLWRDHTVLRTEPSAAPLTP